VLASGQLADRKLGGNDDEVSKGAGTEERSVVAPDASRPVAQEAVDPVQLIDGRLFRRPDQRVAQREQ
jgi:hypothetical protein